MKKKHNITSRLLAACCCLATLLATGCTADDPLQLAPQGSIPLRLSSVSISGIETATRAASTRAEATRAATPEDANGYTGLRKTRFVVGDILNLTLSDGGGSTPRQLTATRQASSGSWQLSGEGSEKVYIIPGTTTITATHTGQAPAGGSAADDLVATTYTLDGQSISLSMTHANALIDVTFAKPVSNVSDFNIHFSTGDVGGSNVPTKETDSKGIDHHTTILAPGASVTQISLKINGVPYIAPLTAPITLAANKRYPISLSFKENRLTATVGAASPDWTIGEKADLHPAGYTYYIGTPEDLAQFAADINAKAIPENSVVLQTADIDLSKLLPLDEAKAKYPDKNYTYTATPAKWVTIAPGNPTFAGKYNGNGYTISNLKGDGLFGCIAQAMLTGIHLRNVDVTSSPLVQRIVAGSTISLCSATGKVTVGNIGGGLIGAANGANISRCSADVEITVNDASASERGVGGLVGICMYGSRITACATSGTITLSVDGVSVGGCAGVIDGSTILACGSAMNIAGGNSSYAFLGSQSADSYVYSCYATGSVSGTPGGFAPNFATSLFKSCAYTGDPIIGNVTGNVAPGNLYKTLTVNPVLKAAGITTLHWSKADGYTFQEVTNDWLAGSIWQENPGSAPTMDLTYEGGGVPPAGYDYYIATPEDLAQMAADINSNTSLSTSKVLQMKDIDLSQLKSAAEANAALGFNKYTYTAKKDSWVPIKQFNGSYNGNGHTINKMKITNVSSMDTDIGFFGSFQGSIIGLNLKEAIIDIAPTSSSEYHDAVGLLAGMCEDDATVALCSVTGSINVSGNVVAKVGGIAGGGTMIVYFTRCSANVDITTSGVDIVGGFIGNPGMGFNIVGCSYNGNIVSDGTVGGFVGYSCQMIMGCSSGGTISGSSVDSYAFSEGSSGTFKSCYSSMTGAQSGFAHSGSFIDCAYTGTQNSAINGITDNLAPGDLYTTLTTTIGLMLEEPNMITLHWSAQDGYTLKQVTGDWKAASVWQNNPGVAPTINLTYEGEGTVAP